MTKDTGRYTKGIRMLEACTIDSLLRTLQDEVKCMRDHADDVEKAIGGLRDWVETRTIGIAKEGEEAEDEEEQV